MKETIIYIVSVGCQLAGALVLLIESSSAKRKNVVKRFIGKGIVFRDNNTNEIYYDKHSFYLEYKKTLLNKMAFGLLSVGYVMGVWGESVTLNESAIALAVGATSVLLMIICHLFTSAIAKAKSKREITNEELIDLKIEPHIENISNDDIDALLI